MDVTVAMEHQAEFALDLHKVVAGTNESEADKGNSLLSPVSITTALAMAGAGAKGETLQEIQTVLKLPEGEGMHQFNCHLKTAILKDGTDVGGPALYFSNGLWVERTLTLKSSFQELVKGRYGVGAFVADFENKAEEERTNINKWVEGETKGKIEDLLPPSSLNEDTAMVLASALYFKGTWKQKFNPEDTKDVDFHLLDGKTVKVPYMTSKRKQCVTEFDTHKVLKMSYVQGDDYRSFSMFFVLPNEKDGITKLEKDLDAENLKNYFNSTRREVEVSQFRLPKFKFSAGFEAGHALQSLGLKAPFSEGADFSDMVEGPKTEFLCLSEVFHKCFIEVNEEGTDAAAATGAVMWSRRACLADPVEFVADHPFLFVLREDVTGLILFLGRIMNPSLSQ